MHTTITMEFEYAYNVWKELQTLDNETIRSLIECYRHTSGNEIDKAAQAYPIEFLNYIDVKIREL